VLDQRLGDDPLSLLVRLFSVSLDVDAARLDEVLAPVGVDGLVRLGIARLEGDRVQPLIHLTPGGAMLFAGDPWGSISALEPLHVVATSLTTALCAQLTIRMPVASALDIGTGSGALAVFASMHADRVVATDVNERALAFTRFNAALNGRTNIETRLGSLLEPVEGERFDLIVSNSPFVISPERKYLFRDAGFELDGLTETLLRGLHEHLQPGGWATVTSSWIQRRGEDQDTALCRWLAGNLDALAFIERSLDPLSHAAAWNFRTADTDPAEFSSVVERWADYLHQADVELVHEGALVLRASDHDRRWVRTQPLPSIAGTGAWQHLTEMFDASDTLRPIDDDELLDRPLRLAARARLLEEWRGDELVGSRLEIVEGVTFRREIDGLTRALLRAPDDGRSAREALTQMLCDQLDMSPQEASEQIGRIGETVRELVAMGFVVA
jgi:methylase of polypeptide subunit release factors